MTDDDRFKVLEDEIESLKNSNAGLEIMITNLTQAMMLMLDEDEGLHEGTHPNEPAPLFQLYN